MDRNDIGWRGNFTAIITPFTQTGGIDAKKFQRNIDLLIQEGVDGIIATGCTGEFWSLTDDEKIRLYQLAKETVAGRVPLLGGTSHMLTEHVIALSNRAKKEVGVDGIMVTPPFYILPNEREITEHYSQISSRVGLPILIYNIPKRQGVTTSPKLLARLSDIDMVVAVKQSSGVFEDVVETIGLCGEKIVVFSGHSVTRGFPCVAMGADGFVSSVEPQVMGKEAIDLYALSASGDTELPRKLQHKLIELDEVVHGIGTFPSALKAAMNLLGRPGGYPRSPILPLTDEETAKLESALERIGFLQPTFK